MNTTDIGPTVSTLLTELLEGSSQRGGYMLNAGDPGLMRSLDRLSAEAASAVPTEGASIAGHVDHLRYGLSLMNRWAAGENPYPDADWSASWRKTEVSEDEWRQLRHQLRDEARLLVEAIREPRELEEVELNGLVGSIAHLAYHVGAIRQMDRRAKGPGAEG